MVDLSIAATYREVRLYAEPGRLHEAIDELLAAGALTVEITPLYEMDLDSEDYFHSDEVDEYLLSATFPGPDEASTSASEES